MEPRQDTKVKVHADLQKLRTLVAKKYEPLFGKELSNPENKSILDALVLDMLSSLAQAIKALYPHLFPQNSEHIVDSILLDINKAHKTKEEQEVVKAIFALIESIDPNDIKQNIETKVYRMYKETHHNENLNNLLFKIILVIIAIFVLAVIF